MTPSGQMSSTGPSRRPSLAQHAARTRAPRAPAVRSSRTELFFPAAHFEHISPRESPMKIAQIAPLMENVPPKLYGGTERVVSHLTEELVALGHQVTLFATGDSITTATLVSSADRAIRLNEDVQDPVPHYMIMLDKVRRLAHRYDVLHFHIDAFHLPLFREVAAKTVTTLHGRQDLPDLLPLYKAFPDMPLVSISDAQRAPIAEANFVNTIYHGLPLNLYRPTYEPKGGYL